MKIRLGVEHQLGETKWAADLFSVVLSRTVLRFWRQLSCWIFFISMIVISAAQPGLSQTGEPDIEIDRDIPYEQVTPWWSDDGTGVEDEVLLTGKLHVVLKVWLSGQNHIDRVTYRANALGINGTSETTGQRFRLTGSFSLDLRNPALTINPDGFVDLPIREYALQLSKVDPEPARLTADSSVGSTASVYISPQTPASVECHRIYDGFGSPTATIDCGDSRFTNFIAPVTYAYRVFASGGDVCISGTPCLVPDGAILFNGFEGDYNTPLLLQARTYAPAGVTQPVATTLDWHCKTGDLEAPVTPGGTFSSCIPFYSSILPINVYAEVRYKIAMYIGGSYQVVSFVVSESPFTYYMLERPMDSAPVIESFNVAASKGPSNRCVLGQPCDVPEGAILHNGMEGDYLPPLYLSLTATDPEGDPVLVQWYCQSGAFFAPVTDLGGGVFSCSPFYTFPGPILVYATVSDGNNEVSSEVRTMYMYERVN